MKSINLYGLMLLCFLSCYESEAQLPPPLHQTLPNKAFLFTSLPDKLIIKNWLIENIFSGAGSGPVKILFAGNNFFEGNIIEKVQKNKNVVTINIKSTNYEGALLTLSKISVANKEDMFTGRIFNIQYGDIFVLKKESDQFFFMKEKQSLVIVE